MDDKQFKELIDAISKLTTAVEDVAACLKSEGDMGQTISMISSALEQIADNQ